MIVGIMAAVAVAVVAIGLGARIDRDVAALRGIPVPAGAADLWLVGSLGAALVLGTTLARQVAFGARSRVAAEAGLFAAAAALFAELFGIVAANVGWRTVAGTAGVIGVGAAVPSGIVALVGVALGVGRLVSFAAEKRRATGTSDRTPSAADTGGRPDNDRRRQSEASAAKRSGGGSSKRQEAGEWSPDGSGPAWDAALLDGQRARWQRGYDFGLGPGAMYDPATMHKEPIGIGLSGGGIRAASVMLGALQNNMFRERVLLKARYLVSVSGGGYTAGAFQQALTGAEPYPAIKGEILRDPRTAFVAGSAEEDHIRRNASYLARNPAEALAALVLLARHLLMNLVVLFGPAIVLGVVAAAFYRAVPLTNLSPVVCAAGTPNPCPDNQTAPLFPQISSVAWIALGALAVLAGLAWLVEQLSAAHAEHTDADPATRRWSRRRAWSSRMVIMVGALFWTTAGLAVVVPTIVWLSAWVMRLSGFAGLAPASIGTLLLTYFSSLAALLWRKRADLKSVADASTIPAAVPRGFGQLLLVVLALAVLAAGWLLLFGGVAVVAFGGDGATNLVVAAAVLVAVSVIGGLVDETSLSLHPFYRRRLARAFAVRAVVPKTGRTPRAVRYAPTERTTLSAYAEIDPSAQAEFPEVIFAASATLGGTRTPPGSNRVSYTFSSRFVGGPEIGYVPTRQLEEASSPRLRRDLTVQGAVALSGAAVAASVGAQNTKWYETLLAVTGVRLGAWMPNPAFVNRDKDRKWYQPGLPRVRRFDYLLRELLGLHSANAPLLQVTDGGFYDNLGLIELFRRRCTTIYCFDASGDNPPPAATLAEVVSLAYQELGVEVDLSDTPFGTTPGSGRPEAPRDALTSLNPRLSASGVMTATFTYPEESGLPAGARTGTLVVAKASLWPELPYQLLAYAMRNPVFPYDSTADQWFDDGQYGAYTALGRELGAAAVTAMGTANRTIATRQRGGRRLTAPSGTP